MIMVLLVTGGAGYIGSLLIRELPLQKEFAGQTIRIFDNMSRETYSTLMNLPKTARYEFVAGDIRNASDIARAMKDVDTVFHLAAITNAPISFEREKSTMDINFSGTKNLAAESVKQNVERFIFTSTASVFGPTEGLVNEDSPCNPESPYGMSKLMAEKALLDAHKEGGLEPIILRLATNFGYAPGFRMDGIVINRLVWLACTRNPITVYGTGQQKRPFLHIKDTVRVLCFAAAHPGMVGQIFNVVGQNASVNEIVNIIREFLPQSDVVNITGTRHLESLSYEMDGSKLARFGFTPKHTVRDGVKELVEFFRGKVCE
ncbi:MAG: NAD-dependent epimerase/dehydratase family protein [Candidatus Aenigmatarchaeota archaeon]